MSEPVSPLMSLAQKLEAQGVPSLSSLIAQIADAENFAEFVDMVKTYLPERVQEILHESTPLSQIALFASYFEDRYFPLDESYKDEDLDSCGYEDITWRIPVVVRGLSYDDYHDIDWRPGAALMTYLIPNPYEEFEVEGALVSLAEACREYVPDALIQRANLCRLSPEDAHRLLEGTKYEPLALWADWLNSCTENFFLDTDYEMLMGCEQPRWTPENVEELTNHWNQAELHGNRTGEFMEWLEGDLPGRFEELLTFIERRGGGEKEVTE